MSPPLAAAAHVSAALPYKEDVWRYVLPGMKQRKLAVKWVRPPGDVDAIPSDPDRDGAATLEANKPV